MEYKIFISLLILFLSGCGIVSSGENFKSYEDQKAYAKKKYEDIHNTVNDLNVLLEGNAANDANDLAWKRREDKIQSNIRTSIETYIALRKAYPEKFNADVDALMRLGDSYFYSRDYDNALPVYEKQLEVFKEKYFKKEYKEKAQWDQKTAQIEECKYLVRLYGEIASCYTQKKEYNKTIENLENAIKLMDEFKVFGVWRIDVWTRYDIFWRTFQGMGEIYKSYLKNYDKAIETYKRMMEVFPDSFLTSRAEIFIGDIYLSMGDVEKAKEIYNGVITKYDKPNTTTDVPEARKRLSGIEKGELNIDGYIYKIKDGKVTVEKYKGKSK